MAWTIEFARSAEKELSKLDPQVTRRILRFLKDRVASDPRSVGEPLKGELSGFWRIGSESVLRETNAPPGICTS
jgi:mRNA interferase RelE/StbE